MDYARVVESLIGGYDLNKATERKKAYRICEEYGTKHIAARLEFNAFMEIVAAKLGMAPTRRNDFRDSVGQVPDRAKLYLTYSPKTGPELTGNAGGLRSRRSGGVVLLAPGYCTPVCGRVHGDSLIRKVRIAACRAGPIRPAPVRPAHLRIL